MTGTTQYLALMTLLAITACAPPPAVISAAATAPTRPCPDWSRSSREDFSNRDASNFGCANTVNFHSQLVDPQDAMRGRGGSIGDGRTAAEAIERLRSNKSQLPAGASTPVAADGEPGGGA